MKKHDTFPDLARGVIAIQKKKKADLAEICGVSRSQFSDYLSGYVPMPEGIRQVLIEELGLEKVWPVLSGGAK